MAKEPKNKTAKKDAVPADEPKVDDAATDDAGAMAATENPDQPTQSADMGAMPLMNVLAQYVKDMSFENPNAPDSLRSGQTQPEVGIDIRIGRTVNPDNSVEIVLMLRADATRAGQPVFIAELEYAGLFAFQNVNLEQMQPMMMIECPRILFPFARKILADMTQDGGFPPIMLDMPDFTSMFREEMMRRAEDATVN